MNSIWIAAFVLQWILLILLSILVVGILRQLRAMQATQAVQTNKSVSAAYRSRFTEGEVVPEFSLPDPQGGLHSTADLIGQKHSVMLLFISTSCTPCHELLQEMEDYYQKKGTSELLMPSDWALWLILSGKSGPTMDVLPSPDREQVTVLVDEDGAVMQEFSIWGVPFGLAIGSQGTVITQRLGPDMEWLRHASEVPST